MPASQSDVFLTGDQHPPHPPRHGAAGAGHHGPVQRAAWCAASTSRSGSMMSVTVVLASFVMAPDDRARACLSSASLICLAVGARRRRRQRRPRPLRRHQSGDHHHRHAERPPGHCALPPPLARRPDQRGLHSTCSGRGSASCRSRSSSSSPSPSPATGWLYRTRSGLRLRAVGFREEAAKRNGVHIDVVHIRAYLLSAVVATFAGFFLASEVGVGHADGRLRPTRSPASPPPSSAAPSLAGGRGSFVGAVLGALFFTLTVNIITLLGLSTARRHHHHRRADAVRGGALLRLAAARLGGAADRRRPRPPRRGPAGVMGGEAR